MRIYDGSPRQDYEEVLRSIGSYLDHRGYRDILLLEAPDGFIVQGLAHVGGAAGSWSESLGQVEKETMTFLDEDIAKFLDESVSRRGQGPQPAAAGAGHYEHALRVIGRYIDEQHPKDVFLFEQDGAFVLRLLHSQQTGAHHSLAEFTRDDVESLISKGPSLRLPARPAGSPDASPA